MTDRPLRLAFVGGFGHHYLRAALDDPSLNIEAVAACPGHGDGDATRQRFKDAAWFDALDALLDQFKPHVINLGTMYGRQGPLIAEALRAGVPVVADKPIAGTWDDLAAIEAAAKQRGAAVITEFDFRARPCFVAAAKAVRDGKIGTVALASAQKSYRFGNRPEFYKHRADYGSTLLWIASHGIDALRFVTDLPFTAVTAQHANVTRPDYGEMEDHCAALYTLGGHATGLVHGDLLRPAAAPTHGDDRLRVVGSIGQLEVRDNRCTLITHDQGPQDITDTASPRPLHVELLDAALSQTDAPFSTAHSLELARILLTTRDAADQHTRLPLSS
jgi:predicted dehydrogenase